MRRFELNVDDKFALEPCNVAHSEENIPARNHREIKSGTVELNQNQCDFPRRLF
jgi:hypothetical protein